MSEKKYTTPEIEKYVTKMAEADEALKQVKKTHFAEIFKQFLDDHPEVEAFGWVQYTPYFNDGDACLFGVREAGAKLTPVASDDEEDDDEKYDAEWARDGEVVPRNHPKSKEIGKLLTQIFRPFPDDLMESTFGDHVQVKVDRKGIHIREYSHD